MIKSLENVLKQFGESMNEEDRSNLKQLLRQLKLEDLLSRQFKFKHIRDRSTVYTAKLKDDLYVISWIENSEENSITYSIAKVKEYIEQGIWVLQEGETNDQ